ncbi:tol-pal system protein YbgF [Vibrio maerlii]|uniref:tol-pal system protein YbgF n=1 Tax=Vibrio maerlii TaxID=2231648 RepID=UPI000E3DDD61|nr:tol-pal system protein YbgF [Vibrio maerlii]
MLSNFKRTAALMLLASAASPVLAAPAPVSEIGSSTSNTAVATTTTSAQAATRSSNETETQRLERLLQNSNRLQLQLQQQIDDMSLEISDLRGQLEKNTYDMQQMLQRQRELFVELDKVRNDVKTAPAVAAVPAETPAEKGGTYSSNADEQTAYQNAVDLILKQKDYTGAITAFESFQATYPDSVYAPNAHYWLGQLHFAKKQDKEAAKNFIAVVGFKDSNKRADALVKLGDIAKRNNNAAKAKEYYQQVVDEYPTSASAKSAKANL